MQTAGVQMQLGTTPTGAPCPDGREGFADRIAMPWPGVLRCARLNLEDDLFRKPVSTFRDHARVYSSLMPVALITPCQRSISWLVNSAAAAVVPPTGSADRSARRLAMSGCRKASLMSALILAAIACGVFGGATTANQADDTNPGSVSAMVGTSGSDFMRRSVPTANNFNWPPCTSASETPRLSNMTSTSPATSPCSAGAEPR